MAELLAGRNNSMGFIRIILASAVVVSHSRVLGFGKTEPLTKFDHNQITLGQVSVYGFFILSGILVTRSGARLSLGRFLWHRALRLLPGLWVCLLVTAFAVSPIVYWKVHGNLNGLMRHDGGPFDYIRANWWISLKQQDISHAMADAVHNSQAHNSSFNGALWSLRYEALCYLGVALLAVTGVLPRARRAVLLIAVVVSWMIIGDATGTQFGRGAYTSPFGHDFSLPLMGYIDGAWFFYLGFAFLIGSVIETFRDRIPVSDVLGVVAVLGVVSTLHYGYFFAFGVPSLAYVLVWLAIRLPTPLRRVGANADYSYGVYIYGFIVEEILVVYGAADWGYAAYLGLAAIGTAVLAMLSWHVVEGPAMRLKDVKPARLLRRRTSESVVVAAETPEPAPLEPQPVGQLNS